MHASVRWRIAIVFGGIGAIALGHQPITVGQTAITGLSASYQPGTSTSFNTTVANPCTTADYSVCGSNITVEFGVGATNDLAVTSFTAGTDTYSLVRLADRIEFQRIDNPGVTGERQLIFFERSGSSRTRMRSSFSNTMEDVMLSALANRGLDNAFSNTPGDVASNNIERIDYIISSGLTLPGAVQGGVGFLILERGGNDPFKIAAITSLDASGNPASFAPIKTISNATWGFSGFNFRTAVMRREANETLFRPSHATGSQPIDGVFISLTDLGISAGQTVYGYALFPNDVPTGSDSNDLVNLVGFPTDTSGASGEGGLDLMAGGGVYLTESLQIITGTLYEDLDMDNSLDGGEPRLPNSIEVILYEDTNNDGDYDAGLDTFVQTTNTTGNNGGYNFIGVADGTYRIHVNLNDPDIPDGLGLDTPNDLEVVVTGTDQTNLDFGFEPVVCNLGTGTTDASLDAYISAEVRGNNATTRGFVDDLDNAWRTAAGLLLTGTVEPWFGAAQALSNHEPDLFTYEIDGRDVSVGVALVNMDGAGDCDGTVNGGASPELDDDTVLQDNAPRPAILYDDGIGTANGHPAMWSETVGSSSSPNGVLFTFSEPVKAFGAWFGDVETRTDGQGAPAYLRLLDVTGDRIGADIAIEPTTLRESSGTTLVNQADCGTGATDRGCGNQSTRWIGFVDNFAVPRVKQVLVVVGDDDSTGDGGAEHISFIGANITSANPNMVLVKRITGINNRSLTALIDGTSAVSPTDPTYVPIPYDDDDNASNWPTGFLQGVIAGETVLPNDELEYTVYFLSDGDVAAGAVLLCDYVPENIIFNPIAYNTSPASDNGLITGIGLASADRGIALNVGGTEVSLTNVADGDGGYYFPPGNNPATIFPDIDCEGDGNSNNSNPNGAVVVNLGNLPYATGPGAPSGSYGSFRFRGTVQ